MIVIFDPSLQNHQGSNSDNLGDVIIYKSVFKIIKSLFPEEEILRFSTHEALSNRQYNIINESKLSFVGGSNLLSSQIWRYNQWQISPRARLYFLNPKIKNAILLGCGWWQYQMKPDIISRFFYNKILDPQYIHSLRDSYACNQLSTVKVKCLNTGCPTMWELHGKKSSRTKLIPDAVVFTLTDYNHNVLADSDLIKFLLERFDSLHFFAQGSKDVDYLKSLDIYKSCQNRIDIIDIMSDYEDLTTNEEIIYIGTRLHGGILAKQNEKDALILGIDNRAVEIQKDTNLAVVKRGDIEGISKWLDTEGGADTIKMNVDNIEIWKKQFDT